ncbi:glycosyltransferase family 2 protein [Enterococcus mundtii]|uniref:glycosyltransferase family 2 protein n=1 Tax=Enterococcus mundtii TaxID=53346 RepID=UPI0035C1EB54
MKKPIFSIIVPVYNAEDTIERSINRLQSLEFNDYEVILVNDGSTDKTEQLIHQLVDKNPKFQWVTTQNQGPGFARNEGSIVRGGIHPLFDADDESSSRIKRI